MKTWEKLTGNDRRIQSRQIARILDSEDLLASINVNTDSRLRPIPISWDEYWSSVKGEMTADLEIQLDELRAARATYLRRKCDYRSAITYCWAYCALLRSALDSRHATDLRLIWAILGFECCAVRWPDCTDALAAATSTSRHPVYLLARLRESRSREDPKFLPLTTVYDPAPTGPPHASLYYHYRQFKIDQGTNASVLVYPSAQAGSRIDSFECIQAITSGLNSGTDPRSRQRAKPIVELALAPFLRKRSESPGFDKTQEIRLLDLGSGSGSLTRSLCETLLADHAEIIGGRFSWTLVDVKFRDPRRHVRDRRFRRILADFRCERTDYLAWIDRQPATASGPSFDVALLCRLLNNASHFSIGWVDDWYQVRKLSAGTLSYGDWRRGSFLPHVCLAGNVGTPTGLSASNRRIPLLNGSSFWQLSLSDYYRGLHLLTAAVDSDTGDTGAIYFPIRRFNDSALLLPSGRSAIDKLCSIANLCVIEDVDLHAGVLRRHLESHKLTALAASDATDGVLMRSASLLCVCRREKANWLPGRRIW